MAAQAVARLAPTGKLRLVLAPDASVLPGYITYDGDLITPFRLTTDDWPPREEISGDIETDILGVYEPKRAEREEPMFRPLDEYLRHFDRSDYRRRPRQGETFIALRV